MLCAKFCWNWPVGSGKEGFHNSSMYGYMHYVAAISTDKRCVPSINPLYSSFLRFTQWFLKVAKLLLIYYFYQGHGPLFKASLGDVFSLFRIISPWKRVGSFIWTDLNPPYPRMLCTKFDWNWPSSFGKENKNVKSLQW